MMRSREEALELTLKQIDRMEWEPAKAEEPDIGTELVLYLMEKNAALVEAATTFLQFWRQNPNGEVTERASLHLHAVLSLPLACDSGSHPEGENAEGG